MVPVRFALCLVALGLVVGCGSVKPPMPDSKYADFSQTRYGIAKCAEMGLLPADTAARGLTYNASAINTYTFDQAKLDGMLQGQRWTPTSGNCNQLAVAINQRQQQIQIHNDAVNSQRDANLIYEATRPKQTYCNRINGGNVLCSSY